MAKLALSCIFSVFLKNYGQETQFCVNCNKKTIVNKFPFCINFILGCMDARALLGRFTRVWVSRREICRFLRVDGWSTDTPGLGRHKLTL